MPKTPTYNRSLWSRLGGGVGWASGLVPFKFMLKSTIFREYDIRGVADRELRSPDVVEPERELGTLLQRSRIA